MFVAYRQALLFRGRCVIVFRRTITTTTSSSNLLPQSPNRDASQTNRSYAIPASNSFVLSPNRITALGYDVTAVRRQFTTSRHILLNNYTPLVPPDPASLPNPRAARHYPRTRRFLRRLFYLAIFASALIISDVQLNHAALTRCLRTFSLGVLVAADYKINFRAHPPLATSIEALHARNAQRLFDLLRTNGGLYLKIGQAIAMQSAVLPPEFQKMFARMFDDAPQNAWKDVERVIREDFGGRSVEDVFGVSFSSEAGKGVMEREARASASVAQVHWARLPDGREVAIKIQKREIAAQVGWDLWAFKVVARVYSWAFDIPMYSMVPYITERLMLETDFVNEADNAEKMRDLVRNEPRLRDRVYIPKAYRELSSSRVMTAEWIEGARLWDKDTITNPWKGGWRKGSPGAGGSALGLPEGGLPTGTLAQERLNGKLKPERNAWKGDKGKGGLGLSLKEVMTTMVDLFSAQMFLWGVLHADPHPGNIFLRRKPNGTAELVLIDHGLYVQMNPSFRHEYALFWKSLLTFDNATIARIVKGWGINSPDIFASATLLRPYQGGDRTVDGQIRSGLKGKDKAERAFEMQQKMRKGIREILGDEKKWPRELIFLGRNLRIVQGNNQFLGSPVNRIKITGMWASRALAESPDLSVTEKARNWTRHVAFRFVLFGSDLYFWFSKTRQFLGLGGGMEDDIEASMRTMAKGFGVELNHKVFEG